MIRIGHCVHGLGVGGAQLIARQIIALRDADRFEHFVYTPEGGVLRRAIEDAGATVRIVPRRVPKLDLGFVRSLAASIKEDRIDVLHAHLFGDALHAHLTSRTARSVPTILTLHSVFDRFSSIQKTAYRWIVPRNRTVACSEAVRRSFLEACDVESDQIVTIRNGIDDPFGAQTDASIDGSWVKDTFRIDDGSIVVAIVGRLVAGKGHRDLIDAVASLSSSAAPRLHLLVVGDGPLKSDLERQARVAKIGHLVSFTGYRDDVYRILEGCDVVAFGSRWEGLSVTMLESMSAARCIVATDIPGIAEAVGHEREALLVPVGDTPRLAEAIRLVASERKLRERLGSAARARFLKDFTARRMVTAYESLYERTAIDHRAPANPAARSPRSSSRATITPRQRIARESIRLKIDRVFEVLARYRRPGAVILNYHRVSDDRSIFGLTVPPDEFEEEMAAFREIVEVLPMDSLVKRLRSGAPLGHHIGAVTFDDGYRDNLEIAEPILRELGMPATVFVTTNFVDSTTPPFWDCLEGSLEAIWATGDATIPWPALEAPRLDAAVSAAISQPGSRNHAEALNQMLSMESPGRRDGVLDRLRNLVGVEANATGRQLMLDWHDVRALAERGIDIACHTLSHPRLSLLPETQALHEIRSAKEKLEKETGREVTGLAFPFGDFTGRISELSSTLDLTYACSTLRGVNLPGCNPFELFRLSGGSSQSARHLGLKVNSRLLCPSVMERFL